MDTSRSQIKVLFDGIEKYIKFSEIDDLLNNESLYSGSARHKEESSIYYFNCVSKVSLSHILKQMEEKSKEVHIEIQTHAIDAETL